MGKLARQSHYHQAPPMHYRRSRRNALPTECSRSVQGTMRLMAQQLTWHFEDPRYDIAEAPAYSLGAWLSDTPCTVKGVKDVIWPRKAMGELISAL